MKYKKEEGNINIDMENKLEKLEPVLKEDVVCIYNCTEIIDTGNELVIRIEGENCKIIIHFESVLKYTVVDSFYVFDTIYEKRSFYKYYDMQFKNVIYRVIKGCNGGENKFLIVTEKYYIEVITDKDFVLSVL